MAKRPSLIVIIGGGFLFLLGMAVVIGTGVQAVEAVRNGAHPRPVAPQTARAAQVQSPRAVKPTPAPVAPIDVSAVDLQKAYSDNEVAADEQFKDRLLRVSGVVKAIGKDIMDTPVVSLKTRDMFNDVACSIADNVNVATLSALKKGQKVALVCKGAGAFIGSAIARDCVLE